MAKYDEMYRSFLEHELLTDKYNIVVDDLPKNVIGSPSNIKIIDTLRLIVKSIELDNNKTDKELVSIISKSLNV